MTQHVHIRRINENSISEVQMCEKREIAYGSRQRSLQVVVHQVDLLDVARRIRIGGRVVRVVVVLRIGVIFFFVPRARASDALPAISTRIDSQSVVVAAAGC